MAEKYEHYYVPAQSHWPIVGAVALGLVIIGAASAINAHSAGTPVHHSIYTTGLLTFAVMLFGWFRDVIKEDHQGLYSKQMDKSFRWGMIWFIFSEVMFFAAFFGALFYVRNLVVPWLGGEGAKLSTHMYLWPNFIPEWPLLNNPLSTPEAFTNPKDYIPAWGLPAINTFILLTSGATLTWAHWGLLKRARTQLIVGLALTVALGIAFIICQAYEYMHAYHELGLTLASGIYGSTFFMLTGFHGMHVTLGTFMLFVVLLRSMKGHFEPERHFAFEAVAWYWHFVDVVWLLLFVLVYWL